MAEKLVTVDAGGLMDTIKDLISKLTAEILTKRNLCASNHDVKIFSSKSSTHGDLLIRKEFMIRVLRECCNDDQQLKVQHR